MTAFRIFKKTKNKEQVFDKPIAYATEAYNKLKDKPNGKIIINSSSGEALVVNKQKDSFDIEVYDENDVKKMKGILKNGSTRCRNLKKS